MYTENQVPVYNGSSATAHLIRLQPQILLNIPIKLIYPMPHLIRQQNLPARVIKPVGNVEVKALRLPANN
ncbi:MAG: hypothetical protein ABSF44_08880 [Candidatus Bathyarchaeia archaeon]